MIRWFLLLCSFCLLPASARAQLKPEEALKKFTVADGLQIELFAAEPMLINPTSIDVDHKGRVWVCEAVNYRRVEFRPADLASRRRSHRRPRRHQRRRQGRQIARLLSGQGDLSRPLGIAVAPYPRRQGHEGFRLPVARHSRFRRQGRRPEGRRPAEEIAHRFRRLRSRSRRARHQHRAGRQALLHRRRSGREEPAMRPTARAASGPATPPIAGPAPSGAATWTARTWN